MAINRNRNNRRDFLKAMGFGGAVVVLPGLASVTDGMTGKKGKILLIGCPKLDDVESHIEKVQAILQGNDLKSFSVIHMEVYCCSGLTTIARKAITRSGKAMAFEDITVGVHGDILQRVAVDQQDVGQRTLFDHTLLAGIRIARAGQREHLAGD